MRKSAVMLLENRQDRSRRLDQSITANGCTKPLAIGM